MPWNLFPVCVIATNYAKGACTSLTWLWHTLKSLPPLRAARVEYIYHRRSGWCLNYNNKTLLIARVSST